MIDTIRDQLRSLILDLQGLDKALVHKAAHRQRRGRSGPGPPAQDRDTLRNRLSDLLTASKEAAVPGLFDVQDPDQGEPVKPKGGKRK